MKRLILSCAVLAQTVLVFGGSREELPTIEQYLRQSVAKREDVANSMVKFHRWRFDGELGVIDGEYVGEEGGLPGGIEGTANVGTFQPNGARTAFLYADQKPRINTYGDSFTHGDQVNDGETWQEYLAGHLREPVGNFGVGGYGVYQAYRRMLREEGTDHAAKYVILTICCDDSTRQLFRSWYPITRALEPRVFGGAKPNVEMDLKTGKFVEKESLVPTEEALYHLTDPEWMVRNLKDDLALQLQLYGGGYWVEGGQRIGSLDRAKITELAKRLDFPFDWSPEKQTETIPSRYAAYGAPPITRTQAQTLALLNRYSQLATVFVLDKARQFARKQGKKLLVILVVNTDGTMLEKGGSRDNQEVVDYLQAEGFDYMDLDQAMVDDYRKAKTSLTYGEYVKKYFVNGAGHLNGLGNHFFAYAIKDKLISLLDPKPKTYEIKGKGKLDRDYFFNARPAPSSGG